MSIWGIDYGKKRIGLAISLYGKLVKPLCVFSRKNFDKTILSLLKSERPEKIVIGITEGKLQKEIENFAHNLKDSYGLEIIFQDETLTSYRANKNLIELKINRKKRKQELDAYAACLILEKYLEEYYEKPTH